MALARALSSLAGYRILVVDDDADARELLRAVLEHEGAHVSEAETALDGVHTARTTGPDVILSDIGMRGHDGIWLFEQLRGPTDPLAVPIVVRRRPSVGSAAVRAMRLF